MQKEYQKLCQENNIIIDDVKAYYVYRKKNVLTCSYKSIRVLSGNLSDWIAWRTISQCPLLMSATKLSTLSTVLSVIVVSSFKIKKIK